MGFNVNVSVPVLTVFAQGLLSFFSPCVLPLLPLYIGYLSGGTGGRGEDGRVRYDQKKVMLHTLCFGVGIGFAFFLLGVGASALGSFFRHGQGFFVKAGGVLVILFGLYQLGLFGSKGFLDRELRLPFRLDRMAMSPLTAFLMGFTFSFAWTPCVGPTLTSVLLMAASAATRWAGLALIGVYTLGFVLPFLAVGMFTTGLLVFFQAHRKVVRYTAKAGGALMVLMGLMMLGGQMDRMSSWLSGLSSQPAAPTAAAAATPSPTLSPTPSPASGEETVLLPTEDLTPEPTAEPVPTPAPTPEPSPPSAPEISEAPEETAPAPAEEPTPAESSEPEETADPNAVPALDFTLEDQFGNTHSLADYKGKTIFLNFWATWCPPCKAEMPEIQQLYDSYSREGEDALIVLGVAGPEMGQEGTVEDITAFLEDNGYTYPVLMDAEWSLFYGYGISAFPTTFMIDREGNVFGYLTGQMSYEVMEDIVGQTMTGQRR